MPQITEIHIRRFAEGDETAVSKVIQQTLIQTNSADYSMDILQPLHDYFSPAKVRILAEERYCLVVESEAGIIGTGSIEDAELKTLFILPEYQGQGIGRKLIGALEAYAEMCHIQEIKVPASITAKDFYKKLGYIEGDTFMSQHSGQQTWMMKRLKGEHLKE